MAIGTIGISQVIKIARMITSVDNVISKKKFLKAIFMPLEQKSKYLLVHKVLASPESMMWILDEMMANEGVRQINVR